MKFKALKYEGAWIPFDGNRVHFRLSVESFLKDALSDPDGKLQVGESGPVWKGSVSLAGLSYANTTGWGVVVFSKTHALGVDLEKADRAVKLKHLELAERFFHAHEFEALKKESVFNSPDLFLELWMKKEAYSKLKRVNLVKFINVEIAGLADFESLVKVREGYRAVVAIA